MAYTALRLQEKEQIELLQNKSSPHQESSLTMGTATSDLSS